MGIASAERVGRAKAIDPAPIAVAAITAMPPPCGVGFACDDRAWARAKT